MADDPPTDAQLMSAQERAALALWLVQQAPFTTKTLAERLGMSRQGTWALMTTISRVVPVCYCDGRWELTNGQPVVDTEGV